MKWKDGEAMYAMIEKIGGREGFGEIFAQGIVKAAEKIGRDADKYAYHVKGVELPDFSLYIPAVALGAALSERASTFDGASAVSDSAETWELMAPHMAHDERIYKEIAPLLKRHKGSYTDIPDMLGVCKFLAGWMPLPLGAYYRVDEMAKFISIATGKDITLEMLYTYSERMDNLIRSFNVREGMTRKDDVVPEIFFTEPSPLRGESLNRKKFNEILDEFYSLKGWDSNGIPTRETLEKLGLKDVADDLEERKLIER
jgi:aldehyde:ferredoxin oxidoreductase